MKKLLLILICLFVSLDPLNGQTNKKSFGETESTLWTKVFKLETGDIEYIDFENIRESGGYVYWYKLTEYLEPKENIMSMSTYYKGDCDEMKYRYVNFNYFSDSMGDNFIISYPPVRDDLKGWRFPTPETRSHYYLKLVCELSEKK